MSPAFAAKTEFFENERKLLLTTNASNSSVEHRTVTPTDRLHSLCGRHSRGPHTYITYVLTKKKNMTASKGDTSASCEKRKSWASIIKRTISFR